MSRTTFARLVDGEPVESLDSFTRPEDIAALLDWMGDIHHGPDGRGPENAGAARALDVLGYHLQHDERAIPVLDTLRRALAHEDDAERKAPSATIALEAARALDDLRQALVDQVGVDAFYAMIFRALPTPIHARYALSILAETRDRFEDHASLLVRATSDRIFGHAESADRDRAYVERISAVLAS